jgi:hypothetical protein
MIINARHFRHWHRTQKFWNYMPFWISDVQTMKVHSLKSRQILPTMKGSKIWNTAGTKYWGYPNKRIYHKTHKDYKTKSKKDNGSIKMCIW